MTAHLPRLALAHAFTAPLLGLVLGALWPSRLLVGAIVLGWLAVGWWLMAGAARVVPPAPPTADERRGGWVAALSATVVGLLLRLAWLDAAPVAIDYDSAQAGVLGWRLLHAGELRTVADRVVLGVESAYFYAVALSLKHLGVSVHSLRLPAAIVGSLTIPAVFLLARELGGRRVGALAAWLVALAAGPVLMSRVSKHSLLVAPALCVAAVALLRAFERGGWWRYLAAGVWAGLGMHTYPSYRHAIPVFLGFAILRGLTARRAERAGHDRPVGLAVGLACLVVGCAMGAGAILAEAIQSPDTWLNPLARNQAPTANVPAGLATVGLWAIVGASTEGVGVTSALGLVAALGCWTLRDWRNPRRLMLAWLVATMVVPPALAAFQLEVARRYVALVPLGATLAAIALVRLVDLGGLPARAGVLALLAGLGGTTLARLDTTQHDEPRLRVEALLRAGRAVADGEPGAIAGPAEQPARVDGLPPETAPVDLRHAPDGPVQVFVPAGIDDGDFRRLVLLLHPRLHALEDNDPLAAADVAGATGHDAVFLPGDTALGWRVRAAFPEARAFGVRLGHGRITRAYLVPREALVSARQPAGALPDRATLRVRRAGRYHIAVGVGAIGALYVGETLVLDRRKGGPSTAVVALTRGNHAVRVDRPQDSPAWSARLFDAKGTTDGVEVWTMTARQGDVLEARGRRVVSAAPRAVPGPRLVYERHLTVPAEGVMARHRDAQDLAVASVAGGDDGLYVATVQRVVKLTEDDKPHPDWKQGLRDEGGPLVQAFGYDYDPPKLWSVAAHPEGGVVVSNRREAWVARFGPTGALEARVGLEETPWITPVDVDVAKDGRVAVADLGQRRVVVLDAEGRLVDELPVGRPVAVAWLGERLALLDAARLGLVVFRPARKHDGRHTFVPLGRVDGRCRLDATPDGGLLLVTPDRLMAFDAALDRRVPGGDPARDPGRRTDTMLVAAARTAEATWLLDRSGRVHRFLHR